MFNDKQEKSTIGIVAQLAALFLGIILMILGVGLSVTMVLLPVGIPVGLTGLVLFIWGMTPGWRL